MKECLDIFASIASILTAVVATVVASYYALDQRNKRLKLENYLKAEMLNNPDRHIHTALHLMARLALTESEILNASFASHHVIRKERVNRDTNLTEQILFEYQERPTSK
jgi:hypothetical protein